MRTLRSDLIFGIGVAIFFVAAVWAAFIVTSNAVNRLLRQDAEAEGEAWARYLAANVRDLPQIVEGEAPSADSMSFFEKAQKVGDVFLYKIYAPDGRLRLSSSEPDEVDSDAESIVEHNPAIAAAVLAGQTVIEVEEDEGGNHEEEEHEIGVEPPAFFSEAYVPVVVDANVIGIMEGYVDQSNKRDAFNAQIGSVALSLAGIIAIAFGVPAFGFYWRTRQKRQADSQVEFLAHHDALTEILNRTRFMHDLEEAIGFGCPVVVHAIDINRFKDINDTLGAAAGDEILRQVAYRLRAVSNRQALLARIGGDEFALAEIARGARQISGTAVRIVGAFGEPFRVGDKDVAVTASVGCAVAPAHGNNAAALLKNAEIALSHSKSEGSSSQSLFRPEMDTELQARRELETRLRNAVANDSFELRYQPLRNASDRRLSGFEALLRLPKDGGGNVSPAIFVPLAERLGLIGEIGDWVIRKACATAATWPGQLTVAVNLSPVQFKDGRLAERVSEALETNGLAPQRLELEITEGLLLADTDSVMRQLADLKALGVRIAMDDFGTGYSSLSYLWKFPFDKLKIDQSFTRALGTGDQHLSSVIQAIVALGRSLEMTITAEGVETEAQADFLSKVGCHQLQGFHLGRPMQLQQVAAEILGDFRGAMVADRPEPDAQRVAREA
jgi:diguanylate cyclase (GGDEF)-like protein